MDYYTLEEVKQNEYWIAIQNNVYDISSYIQRNIHPGGNDVLCNYLGTDATEIFKNTHSLNAWNDLEQFRIGKLNCNNRYSISNIMRYVYNICGMRIYSTLLRK